MTTEAYLVLGDRHHRSVHLHREPALQQAVKHHGVVYELVRADHVNEMLTIAYMQGQASATEARRAQH